MEAQVADVVRIRLLGGFQASSGEKQVPASGWRLRKAKTLVKLLALEPAHAMHVEQAADVLWPDRDSAAARNNLHQAVYVARRALSALDVDSPSIITLNDDLLTLGRDVDVVIDIDELRIAIRNAVDAGDNDRIVSLLHDSPPELLPEDSYEPWLQPHGIAYREWRAEVALGAADRLIDTGVPEKAVVLLAPIVAADPLNEPAVRASMRALAASGRRSEALIIYERMRAKLQDELAADPEPETRTLFRDLLTASTTPTTDAPTATIPTQRAVGNLPMAVSSLIGRNRELDEVTSTLARTRLLTLTGMGGVGKTSLAVAAARRIAGHYSDGAYLVELGALRSGDQVTPQLARSLQLAVPPDSSPVEAVIAQLRTRTVLIVLDNCEHLLDACAPVVSELLRGCAGLSVIATSREPLRVEGEVSWRTPSLELPDPTCTDRTNLQDVPSVELFVQRAAAALPGFSLTEDNSAAVATIAHRLDGIPLALELAAACVSMLAPEQIAVRLGDAMALLRHGGRALTRQQTLEATLAWSHDLLAPDEQVLFRRLGVFVGSFTLDAIEAICANDFSAEAVMSALARLVDTSLIVVDLCGEATRYRLLDTVRQYAAKQLRSSRELAAVERRHCEWYLTFALDRDPELVGLTNVAPVSLDLEHDNLRTALSWALQNDPTAGLRLAVSLWRYWLARGFLAEGRRWLEAALEAATVRSADRARALVALGAFDVRRGTGERLSALGAEAVAIHRALNDDAGLAQSLCARAMFAFLFGGWDECWQLTADSREAARRSGAIQHEIGALHVQGIVRSAQGRLEEARAVFDEARAMLTRIDDAPCPFLRPLSQGFAVDADSCGEPRIYFEETVLHGRIVGVQQAEAHLLCNLADLDRASGELDRALEAVQRAEDIFATIGDGDGEAVALNRRGCLHRVRREHDAAHEALTRSLTLRRTSGERRAILLTRSNLGLLLAAQGDIARGRAIIEEQIRHASDIRDVAAQTGLTVTLASLEANASDDETASRHIASVLNPAGWSVPGCHRPLTWALLMQAAARSRLGDAEGAAAAHHEARQLFTGLGAVDGVAALDRMSRQQSRV